MDSENDFSTASADLNADHDEAERAPFDKPDFNPDEWELVDTDHCLLDIHGITKKNFLQTCDTERVKLIGLFDPDGKTFLQLDQYVFVGEPQETFGTNVFFEETENTDSSGDEEDTFKNCTTDSESTSNAKLEYFAKTDKKISLYRALLHEKDQKSKN